MTYEGAEPSTITPYFSHRFRPLQPLVVYGRDAKQAPTCPPSHAVWYAWKDVELSACPEWVSGHAPVFVHGGAGGSPRLSCRALDRPGRACEELAAPTLGTGWSLQRCFFPSSHSLGASMQGRAHVWGVHLRAFGGRFCLQKLFFNQPSPLDYLSAPRDSCPHFTVFLFYLSFFISR